MILLLKPRATRYLGCKGSWVQIPPRRPFKSPNSHQFPPQFTLLTKTRKTPETGRFVPFLRKLLVENVWNASSNTNAQARAVGAV